MRMRNEFACAETKVRQNGHPGTGRRVAVHAFKGQSWASTPRGNKLGRMSVNVSTPANLSPLRMTAS